MAWSADKVSTYIASLLIRQPVGSIEVAQQYRATFHQLLSRNVSKRGLDVHGDYALLREIVSQPVAATGRVEAGDVVHPRPTTAASGQITAKQIMGSIGWTVEMFEDTMSDRQVYDMAVGRWDRHINGVIGVLNAVDLGDGTGRLARVLSSVDNSTYYTVTVDNAQKDWAWDLLDIMEDGFLVDIYTVPDITGTANWTPKVSEGEVYGVNKAAGTFNVKATAGVTKSRLVANPADNDVVFLAGSFTSTTQDATYGYETGKCTAPGCWKVPMGIRGIIDDGDSAGSEFGDGSALKCGSFYGATWQGRDRTAAANVTYRAIFHRADTWYSGGAPGTKYPATLEALYGLYDQLYASGTRPDPATMINIVSPPTYRWITRQASAEGNAMQDVSGGSVFAGLDLAGIRITCGNEGVRVIPFKQDMSMPDGAVLAADMGRIGIWPVMELGPMARNPGGPMQFASPGTRNLTIESWSRTRFEMFTQRCDTSGLVCDINVYA